MQASRIEGAAIGVVIMAAGAGRRLGHRPKPLLRRDGEPLLLRQVRIAAAAGAAAIVVVLGHHADRLAAALDQSRACAPNRHPGVPVQRAINPAPDEGTGSSVRCGLAALPHGLSTYLVMLGDQPLLEVEDVQAVLAAWQARATGIQLLVPQHAGRLGHPVIFGPEVFAAVGRAREGFGVREWRRAHAEHVSILPASHARFTTDVDTPADLDRLRDAFGIELSWPGT